MMSDRYRQLSALIPKEFMMLLSSLMDMSASVSLLKINSSPPFVSLEVVGDFDDVDDDEWDG